jgi:hypothetical protein
LTIEEIYIFGNSSHLEWKSGLSDTISKGGHIRNIPTKFGLIWFRGFRGEDLNVKNVNCSYMAMSSFIYIQGFSVKFFFLLIYTDYAN